MKMVSALGIDVSKASLACALIDGEAAKCRWQREYQNTEQGVRRLLEQTPVEVPWILEPTGRYSLLVAKLARAAGRDVRLAPPRQAKRYLNSLQDRAKNDRLDGVGLGWFGATRPPSQPLAPYPVPSAEVEQLQQLLAARRGVVEAQTSLRQRVAELPYAAAALKAAVTALAEQQEALDKQIETATQAVAKKQLKRLREVHGIGSVTASTIVARMQGRRFARVDQWVAFIGFDVGIVESGKRKGQRGLTKQGDAELRRLLYLCAQSAIRSKKGPFQAQYQRELARGRKKTAALCIIARKLAKVAWAIVEKGVSYDAEKVYAPVADSSESGGRTQGVSSAPELGASTSGEN
jgi:transposase